MVLDADATTARCSTWTRDRRKDEAVTGAAVLPSRGTRRCSMAHVARGGLVLLATAILTLAGLREVTAGPCKADGQTCRTNQSCCGSGKNGVCVKAGGKFGTCCTPVTCTAVDCGSTSDGCGGVNECACAICEEHCANGFAFPNSCAGSIALCDQLCTQSRCDSECQSVAASTCAAFGCSPCAP